MARKKIAEGYGGTSEQRQRHLQGDDFSERAPRTPAEAEAARSTPDKDGAHVTLHPLQDEDEDDLWRGEP
ncbi:hypothetical protein [Myxococcus landrumensis]|uniref:Uncharacterized protein n=1 Tax=Myxococcus landrumensis TaxID=2813577 RepID=A0ABX7NGP9_9BACT|nr:hypothetical protein [Myxococcus landrumus]QSQ15503.1 hypothetical protein JY572_05365 [Myxococcus landrumus]